jgi:hypothetical protein
VVDERRQRPGVVFQLETQRATNAQILLDIAVKIILTLSLAPYHRDGWDIVGRVANELTSSFSVDGYASSLVSAYCAASGWHDFNRLPLDPIHRAHAAAALADMPNMVLYQRIR